jgi:hypothetical protein
MSYRHSIQEVVLAKTVVFSCGQQSMSWADLGLLSHFFANTSWTILLKQSAQIDQLKGALSIGHNTPARLASAQRTWRSGHDDQFLYALIRARSSASENPRDKVYSQLGLGSANIVPDYQASVADVYITTAKYILEHSQSLLLLTCAEGADFQNIPGLPSWVPDWSVTQNVGLRSSGYRSFHAALQLPKRQAVSIDSNGRHILSIGAIELDEILDTCDTKPEIRNKPHTSILWEIISKLHPHYAASGQSREEAVWRTLITNREDTGSLARPRDLIYPASAERLYSSFRAWVLWRYVTAPEAPSTNSISIPAEEDMLPSQAEILDAREKSAADLTYLADLEHSASLYDLHYSHAMSLRPFCTRQGYFGIGTQCLRKDDSVWIVHGCPVPLILRKIEGSERYRLVGGSYVHGFMDGEALGREGVQFKMVCLE